MNMDFNILNEEISKLAEILNNSGLGEIAIENAEFSICVKAKAENTMVTASASQGVAPAVVAAPASQVTGVEKYDGFLVTSPIVGTFFAASAPENPPFITVGTRVKKGDVLFIIESMKLMNEVQSTCDGVVSEILVSDAQAVEFGQPVVVIK